MAGERIDKANLDWAGNAPRSIFFDDIYFSESGLDESRHVFLRGAGLEEIFSAGGQIAVGELGFGSGLNLLAAWALFNDTAPPSARLDFFSVEKYPLSLQSLERAHAAWPELAGPAARLRAALPPAAPGFHLVRLDARTTLTLALGDAGAALRAALGRFDAFFLDGFAPAKNPDMWSADIFTALFRLMRPGARAATFTVAGDVRRGLAAAGFAVEKRAGFGRKREMTVAVRGPGDAPSERRPWFLAPAAPLQPGARIAVIGGGVAGAAMAEAAARRGFAPVILEKRGLAAGASGNKAGLIMPRLDLAGGPLAAFWRNAFLLARARLDDAPADQMIFDPCGVLLKAMTARDAERHERIFAEGALPAAHLERRGDDLFYPAAGVVDPVRWVHFLASRFERIDATALRIEALDEGVAIATDRGDIYADAAVIAAGADARRFAALRACALGATAGQIDWFARAPSPASAIAGGPYAAPAPGGGAIIGATYAPDAGDDDPVPSEAATAENLARLEALDPALAASLAGLAPQSRAARRAVTPDRAPLVGPAPDIDGYGAAFDDLRFGRDRAWPAAPLRRGVFILGGLGSRGLVTAPLAAEMLAAMLAGAPSPVDRDAAHALHPARFFIRDLKRAVIVRKS